MRLTFPPISSTGLTRLASFAVLACVPMVVNIVAKRVFGTFCDRRQTFKYSLGTSLASMLTLVKNPWAAVGSAVPLYLYLVICARASKTRLPVTSETPKWEIQNIISVEEKLIKVLQTGENAKTKGLYQHDVDVVDRLKTLDKCRAKGRNETIDDYFFNSLLPLQAATIFKALLKRLDKPLLESIQSQLLGEDGRIPENYPNALSKLDPNQSQLLKMTIEHLTSISKQHGPNEDITIVSLSKVFAPLFFNMGNPYDRRHIPILVGCCARIITVLIKHPKYFTT